jgi:hypothetical protein
MIDTRAGGRRAVAMLLLIGASAAGPLGAQIQRDSLVTKAFDEFDTGRRLQLLRAALDPSRGPLTGSWATGVQLLGQTLLEERQDSLAVTWLRWAARSSPDLQPDTVQFLPSATAALRGAQDFVRRTHTPGDSLTNTSWTWPAGDNTERLGKLRVSAPGLAVPLTAAAVRVGPLTPNQATELAPGSYEIRAAAAGYDSLVVTREVLPAVTTVVELRPRPLLARGVAPAAPAPQPATPTLPPVASKPHKKFPWLVIVGVAAAGGAVAALAGGGGGSDTPPPPTTGGITVTFPNP